MAKVRFLDLVKPVMFLIPQIKKPTKNVSRNDKRNFHAHGVQSPYLSI